MDNNFIAIIPIDVFDNGIRVKNLDQIFEVIHENDDQVYIRKGDDYSSFFLITDVEVPDAEVDWLIKACNNAFEIAAEITGGYDHDASVSGDELQEQFRDTLDEVQVMSSVTYSDGQLKFCLNDDDIEWVVIDADI